MTGKENSAKYKIASGNCWNWIVYKKIFFFIWWPVYFTETYGSAVQYVKNYTINIRYFDENGEELCN